MKRLALAFLLLGCVVTAQQAPVSPKPADAPYFTDAFPPEEFAARRAAVMKQIGDAVAIIQGAPEMSAEVAFRQNNQFFYLTGVEVPRAIVVIDGKTRKSTLFLGPPRRERYNGPELGPGDEAARITGIEAVVERDSFAAVVTQFGQDGRVVYTPFRAEVRGGGSGGESTAHAKATAGDPWDGRPPREMAFQQKLQAGAPKIASRTSIRSSTRCASSRARARSR